MFNSLSLSLSGGGSDVDPVKLKRRVRVFDIASSIKSFPNQPALLILSRFAHPQNSDASICNEPSLKANISIMLVSIFYWVVELDLSHSTLMLIVQGDKG